MQLSVRPLKRRDAGRGLAAIDREAMRELGVESNDQVAIEGAERTYARAWPGYPEDDGEGVVRIDGRLRQAAGVGLDDPVTVSKVSVSQAERVTVALPAAVRAQGNVARLVRDELGGQPVAAGQRVSVPFGPRPGTTDTRIPVVVRAVAPSEPAVVSPATVVDVADDPLEDAAATAGGSLDAEQPGADDPRLRGDLLQVARRVPGSGQLVAHPVAGVAVVLLVVAALVGGAYSLSRVTSETFLAWLQVVGPLSILVVSVLSLWYTLTR